MGVWLAAAVGAVSYFVLGAAWFTPLFGRVWDRSIGYDRATGGGRFPISYYLVPLITALVIASVLGALAHALAIDGLLQGTVLGAGIGIAIAAASLTNALTPHTPHTYLFGAVTGGYHFVGCTLTGLLIGALG